MQATTNALPHATAHTENVYEMENRLNNNKESQPPKHTHSPRAREAHREVLVRTHCMKRTVFEKVVK